MASRTLSAFCMVVIATHLSSRAATLEVDKSRSRIQVDASATGHGFTGTLGDFTTKCVGDRKSLDPTGFELKWSFNNLRTGDEKRDREMIQWLGGGEPQGRFTFTKSWTEKDGTRKAMGNLTIHGVSKTISFPFTTKADGDWVTIDGTASLDTRNHKLPIIRAMGFMTVDPKLVVRFHLVGKTR